MKKDTSIKKWFGTDLAKLLSSKIEPVYPSFDTNGYLFFISIGIRAFLIIPNILFNILHGELVTFEYKLIKGNALATLRH